MPVPPKDLWKPLPKWADNRAEFFYDDQTYNKLPQMLRQNIGKDQLGQGHILHMTRDGLTEYKQVSRGGSQRGRGRGRGVGHEERKLSKGYYWSGALDDPEAITKPNLKKHVEAKQGKIDTRELGHGKYQEKPAKRTNKKERKDPRPPHGCDFEVYAYYWAKNVVEHICLPPEPFENLRLEKKDDGSAELTGRVEELKDCF